MKYDVMLDAQNGTNRLVNDANGAYWEKCYSIIRWSQEDSPDEAQAVVDAALLNPTVRRAWFVPIPLDFQPPF